MNIIDAPSPVVATKLAIKNVTVSTAVRVECPPGFWGTNGECKPCAKGTYRPASGTNVTGCLECPADTYQDQSGASDCIDCGVGYTCQKGSVVPIPKNCDPGTFY